MSLCDPAAYSQTQANSSRFTRTGFVSTVKSLEDVRQILDGNPNARVADLSNRKAVLLAHNNVHPTSHGGVFDCVADQDQEQPPQCMRICIDPNRLLWNLLPKA